MEAVMLDFDGVVANVNIERALAAARPYAADFLMPPQEILIDYFYHNPYNTALDLGLVTTQAVRETIRPKLWRGGIEDWFAWWESVEDAYQVSDGMSELLAELESRYRLGMISDNHVGFRQWLKARPDINRYFDVVVCSAEVGLKKPSRLIFRLIVEQLGTTFRNTIYVDDDVNNVDAARVLGIPSIHFESVEQTRHELARILGHNL